MSTDTTKAMEDALQAAVARMSGGGSNGDASGTTGGMPMEPMGLLMALLPKLLENNDEREDLAEKLDELEKEKFGPLQEQIRGARKQIHRVFKVQELCLAELREMREQQTAIGNAVLHLARQMARVEIMDDISDDSRASYDDDDDDDYDDDDDDELLADADVYDDLSSAIAAERKSRPQPNVTQPKKRSRPRRR